MLETHLYKGVLTSADGLGIDQRHVTFDYPFLLKFPHPPQTRRGRNAHPLGKLLIGDAGVSLQYPQYFEICLVQQHVRNLSQEYGVETINYCVLVSS